MNLIASGLGNHVDLRAGGVTVFGVLLTGLHLEFGESVEIGVKLSDM